MAVGSNIKRYVEGVLAALGLTVGSGTVAATDADINGVAASGRFTVNSRPIEGETWALLGFDSNGPTFTFTEENDSDYEISNTAGLNLAGFIDYLVALLNDIDSNFGYMSDTEKAAIRGITWSRVGDNTLKGVADEKGELGNTFRQEESSDGAIVPPTSYFTGGVNGIEQTKLDTSSNNIICTTNVVINSQNYWRYNGKNLVFYTPYGVYLDSNLEDTGFNCTITNRSNALIGVNGGGLQIVPSTSEANSISVPANEYMLTVATLNVVGTEAHFFGNIISD